jgi:hypothetical protein
MSGWTQELLGAPTPEWLEANPAKYLGSNETGIRFPYHGE